MTREEVIELGTKLGLKYNEELTDEKTQSAIDDETYTKYVVFDGIDEQRFTIPVSIVKDDYIYRQLGLALRLIGRVEMKNACTFTVKQTTVINNDY